MHSVTVQSDDGVRAAFDPYYGFQASVQLTERRAMELYAKAALHHPGHFIPVKSMVEDVRMKKEGIVFRFKERDHLLRDPLGEPYVTGCRELSGGNWSFSFERSLNPVETRLVFDYLRDAYPHLFIKLEATQH